ncbi:MAG: AraC family transcriptional regulator [Planctomycetota bacterium]
MDISIIDLPAPDGLKSVPPAAPASTVGAWYGLSLFNAGLARVAQTDRHPHEGGRRQFEFFGICRVVRGAGVHWTAESGWQRVTRGDIILSVPHHPHCYGPAPDEAWCEDMLSFQGPRADALLQRGILSAERGLLRSPAAGPGLRRIIALLARQTDAAQLRAASLLEHLLMELYLESLAEEGNQSRHGEALDDLVFQIETDPTHPWTVEALAHRVGLSIPQFRRLFKERFGVGGAAFVEATRMERARQLLTTTQAAIKSIAIQCGYPDPFHFSRSFSRLHSMPPSQYRRAARLMSDEG